MKKTYIELLALLSKWVGKAEALKLAGIDISYNCYTSGSYYYQHVSFSVNDVEFKVETDKEFPQDEFLAVEAELNKLADTAVASLSERIEIAIEDIKACKSAIENING